MPDGVFMAKAVRNLLFARKHPFFAHFFVTERCNLRCSYCEVHKHPRAELDEAGCKKVIDSLAELSVAVLSFTGGEPLLRDDIYRLIDYGKKRRLHTKITSNGTMPLTAYRRLLDSSIDSISISMDGLEADAAGTRVKMSPRVLEKLEFLHAHRGEKRLNVSAVHYNGNAELITRLIDDLDVRLPGLDVFVQPVVGGTGGSFRSTAYDNVDTKLLRDMESRRNVANPTYFNDHCERYFRARGNYPWGCKAGQMFFDIKPDGSFWLCQDRPTHLNLLDPDFKRRWRRIPFETLRSSCPGCTYSCYVLTQKTFEWKNARAWYRYRKRL